MSGDSNASRRILAAGGDRAIPFAPPQVAGYDLAESLGHGGMGVVYRATQHEPRREVALKVLRGELGSPRALARFRREVEVLARIRHRAVVRILDAGLSAEGNPFYAMELVDGCTWQEHLRSAPGLRDRLALFLQVCEGVAFLHREGVLHRDLKPGNLRVDPNGRVRILDFGLARTLDAASMEVTRAGEPLGTSQYMSPEQWHDSSRVDGRSDVYSLGVILFELVGGKLAEELPSSSEMWREDRSLGLRAREELAVDDDLRAIIASALEIEPEERTPDPEALALDLRRYLTDRPVEARRTPPWRRARLCLRRNAAPLWRLAAVGGILLLCSLVAAREWSRSERYRREAEAGIACTLEACSFILGELGPESTVTTQLRREDVVATLDEVLAVLATLPAEGSGPAAPLAERARGLRAELGADPGR